MVRSLNRFGRELETLCRRYGVRRLELFGSAARGEAEPRDFDFIVHFEPRPDDNHFHRYFDLKFALEDTLGRPVDLLDVEAIRNQAFLRAIETERADVYVQ